MSPRPESLRVLIQRLRECESEQIISNPSLMLKFYPIRDPDNEKTIFDEVYSELNEDLLLKKYRFRFLYFLNTLLSSSKVPGYVIATYMKRLSRLSLSAKPKMLAAILKLVGNLLLRHPTLLILRDRVDELARRMESSSPECTLRMWLNEDPFKVDPDISTKDTRAMESSLWELMPLRYHENPKIIQLASYLNSTSTIDIEYDLGIYI